MFGSLQGIVDSYHSEAKQQWRPTRQMRYTTENKSKHLDKREIRSPLRILDIDFCISDNGTRHNTGKFNAMQSKDDPQLIVRRGQVFFLKLLIDRKYSPHVDGLSIVFISAGLNTYFKMITQT